VVNSIVSVNFFEKQALNATSCVNNFCYSVLLIMDIPTSHTPNVQYTEWTESVWCKNGSRNIWKKLCK